MQCIGRPEDGAEHGTVEGSTPGDTLFGIQSSARFLAIEVFDDPEQCRHPGAAAYHLNCVHICWGDLGVFQCLYSKDNCKSEKLDLQIICHCMRPKCNSQLM